MFYLFKFFSRKKLSLAEEVNRKVMSGYKPSNEALIIAKKLALNFNSDMKKCVDEYNKTHTNKIFEND